VTRTVRRWTGRRHSTRTLDDHAAPCVNLSLVAAKCGRACGCDFKPFFLESSHLTDTVQEAPQLCSGIGSFGMGNSVHDPQSTVYAV